MQQRKNVENIMVNVFDFPVVPSWYTISQAIDIIQKSTPAIEKNLQPVGLLIFDEHYNLLGSLSLKDILKGLEPSFLKPVKAQVTEANEAELALIWDSLFDSEAMKLAEKQVVEVMVPVKHFVAPEDPATKAAYLMTHYDLSFLPVLEGGKKLVGVIRLFDVFQELSNIIRQE
jgi:Mg/Co/Ni transporter MgtE